MTDFVNWLSKQDREGGHETGKSRHHAFETRMQALSTHNLNLLKPVDEKKPESVERCLQEFPDIKKAICRAP